MFSVTTLAHEYLLRAMTISNMVIPTVDRAIVGVNHHAAVVTLNMVDIVLTLLLSFATEGLNISHDISCTHNIISLW
jgi:hypothetical protein